MEPSALACQKLGLHGGETRKQGFSVVMRVCRHT